MTHDVAVVGGGAAGLMAAIFAARAGRRTVLCEGSKQCGLKILVSGGTRCNVLPSIFDESDFFTSGSRNLLRRLFRTWPLERVVTFFENDLAIPLVEEPETGKLFPRSQRARDVRDALVAAVEAAGGVVRTDTRITSCTPPGSEMTGGSPDGTTFALTTATGERIVARRVVLTTGGLSLPKTGSDGWGYEAVRALGHEIRPTYPALVPLTTDDERLTALAGISLPVAWRARTTTGSVREARTRELLFTHRGFSGPAILDASHWAVRDGLDLVLGFGGISREEWDARFRSARARTCGAILADHLPRRLAGALLASAGVPADLKASQLRRDDRRRLIDAACAFVLPVTGNTGYRFAEVTGGGVPLEEVHASTLESRQRRGLHLAGEIFDVIGRIGGYNFLWAWVTGRLAGEAAAASLSSASS